MEPLFPPWSNSVARASLLSLVAAVLGAPTALIAWVRTPYVTGEAIPVEQPVQFDHRHHVRDDGIDCLYCHTDAETSRFAGLPPTATCMGCHAQVWADAPQLAPVRESALTGEPIGWNRVYDLPDFVYFDHAAHVDRGVGCAECHGRVDEQAKIYQAQPLTMQWCLGCHRDPGPHLRPQDAITDPEWPADEQVGRAIAAELRIAPPTNCTGCHR